MLKNCECKSWWRPQAPDVKYFSHIKNKYTITKNTQGTHRCYLGLISNSQQVEIFFIKLNGKFILQSSPSPGRSFSI